MDNMEGMRKYPDGYFELAIVDPPYGINESKRDSYHLGASTRYKVKKWDNEVPKPEYWVELFRVSKHQIIFGWNYFSLPPCKKPIVWDKQQPEGIDQAMHELAWQSQEDKQAMIFRRSPAADNNNVANGDSRLKKVRMRIHPTQKPVALYKWLLKNYAKPGDKILDSHGGSMSSVIACLDMGFQITCFEKDPDYARDAKTRILNYLQQQKLFSQHGEIEFHY